MIDQWRWKVFSGEIPPEKYNEAWWDLRLKYQGVAPPVSRSERISIPAQSTMSRRTCRTYDIFWRIFCNSSFTARCPISRGVTDPLNRCSIYDNQDAGKKLNAMLEMGASKPWQDALFELTGQHEMDATAIRDYFAPLEKWLAAQNRGKPVGW